MSPPTRAEEKPIEQRAFFPNTSEADSKEEEKAEILEIESKATPMGSNIDVNIETVGSEAKGIEEKVGAEANSVNGVINSATSGLDAKYRDEAKESLEYEKELYKHFKDCIFDKNANESNDIETKNGIILNSGDFEKTMNSLNKLRFENKHNEKVSKPDLKKMNNIRGKLHFLLIRNYLDYYVSNIRDIPKFFLKEPTFVKYFQNVIKKYYQCTNFIETDEKAINENDMNNSSNANGGKYFYQVYKGMLYKIKYNPTAAFGSVDMKQLEMKNVEPSLLINQGPDKFREVRIYWYSPYVALGKIPICVSFGNIGPNGTETTSLVFMIIFGLYLLCFFVSSWEFFLFFFHVTLYIQLLKKFGVTSKKQKLLSMFAFDDQSPKLFWKTFLLATLFLLVVLYCKCMFFPCCAVFFREVSNDASEGRQ